MTNMKVPPPVVTGIAIPGDLRTTTDADRYNRHKDILNQAQNEVQSVTKSYAKKDKYATPLSVKIFGGSVVAALLVGLTMLLRKGKGAKKPPVPATPAAPAAP